MLGEYCIANGRIPGTPLWELATLPRQRRKYSRFRLRGRTSLKSGLESRRKHDPCREGEVERRRNLVGLFCGLFRLTERRR